MCDIAIIDNFLSMTQRIIFHGVSNSKKKTKTNNFRLIWGVNLLSFAVFISAMTQHLSYRNIYEAIRPFHLYSKIFGLTCFTLKRSLDGKVVASLTLLDAVNSMVVVFFSIFSTFSFFRSYHSNIRKFAVSETFTSVAPIGMLACLAVCLVSNFATILFRKKIAKAFNFLAEFDDRVIRNHQFWASLQKSSFPGSRHRNGAFKCQKMAQNPRNNFNFSRHPNSFSPCSKSFPRSFLNNLHKQLQCDPFLLQYENFPNFDVSVFVFHVFCWITWEKFEWIFRFKV